MKKILIVTVLLSLFLITSCSNSNNNTINVEKVFIGGNKGLDVNFEMISNVQEEGIETIYDEDNFNLDFIVKNLGEYDVKPNEVSLKLLGPAKTDFTGISTWEKKNSQEIEKISDYNPNGGEEIVSFTNNGKYTNNIIGFRDINWNLEYSYDYKTYLVINNVCFKGNPNDARICSLEGKKDFSVSGAPIIITNVEQELGGKGIVVLRIDVQNIGNGDFTLKGQEFDNRYDKLSYKIDESSKWKCVSGGQENEARFTSNTAQIFCKLNSPLSENELYEKAITLEFEYTYRDMISKKLRIKETN
jgi:hypothetical protein